jgi:hypothetical protein
MIKEKSFWTPVKPNKNIKPTRLFGYEMNVHPRHNFDIKPRAPISPVKLAMYPQRTPREIKLINRAPWADTDKDGVPNYFDCKPLNKKKQGWVKIKEGSARVWRPTPVERRENYKKLREVGASVELANQVKNWRPQKVKLVLSREHESELLKMDRERVEQRVKETGKKTPEWKLEEGRKYSKTPEYKEYKREYAKRPLVFKQRKEYRNRPEIKEKYLELARERYHKPGTLEKERARGIERHNIKKIKEMVPGLEFGEEYKKERRERLEKIKGKVIAREKSQLSKIKKFFRMDKRGYFLPELYEDEKEADKKPLRRTKEEILEDKRLEDWAKKRYSKEEIQRREEQDRRLLEKKMGLMKDKRAYFLPQDEKEKELPAVIKEKLEKVQEEDKKLTEEAESKRDWIKEFAEKRKATRGIFIDKRGKWTPYGWRATKEELQENYKKAREAGATVELAQRIKGFRPSKLKYILEKKPKHGLFKMYGERQKERIEETGLKTPGYKLEEVRESKARVPIKKYEAEMLDANIAKFIDEDASKQKIFERLQKPSVIKKLKDIGMATKIKNEITSYNKEKRQFIKGLMGDKRAMVLPRERKELTEKIKKTFSSEDFDKFIKEVNTPKDWGKKQPPILNRRTLSFTKTKEGLLKRKFGDELTEEEPSNKRNLTQKEKNILKFKARDTLKRIAEESGESPFSKSEDNYLKNLSEVTDDYKINKAKAEVILESEFNTSLEEEPSKKEAKGSAQELIDIADSSEEEFKESAESIGSEPEMDTSEKSAQELIDEA